jgi:hypothetical protein
VLPVEAFLTWQLPMPVATQEMVAVPPAWIAAGLMLTVSEAPAAVVAEVEVAAVITGVEVARVPVLGLLAPELGVLETGALCIPDVQEPSSIAAVRGPTAP